MDDEVEVIYIDLDDESNSDDGSVKSDRRTRSSAIVDLVNIDDESEEPARNKRNNFRYSNIKSRKRFVRRQNLCESDDESSGKGVRKKRECSSDSDYEPSIRHIAKKTRSSSDHAGDSSQNRVPGRRKSSASYVAPVRRKSAAKSERLDSDEENARSSVVRVSRRAMKTESNDAEIVRSSVVKVSTRARKSERDDAEIVRNSVAKASKATGPRKRKKVTTLRGRTFVEEVDEADDSANVTDKSSSCLNSTDNGLNSDRDEPRSSQEEKVGPVEKCLPQMEADAVNGAVDIPNDSHPCLDSDQNRSDSSTETPSSSSSANAASKTETNEAPLKDEENKNEMNSSDGSKNCLIIPEKSGFECGLRAIKIFGITDYGPGGVKFLIQFQGRKDAEFVPTEKCREFCPELMIKFYEQHISWTNSQ